MDRKIVGYYICEKPNIKDLTADVWRLIGEGWVPCGGVTRSANGSGIGANYLQAMLKYAAAE